MAMISVMLVDDHTVVRQGLAALLRAEPDLQVLAEASDGRQAIELARSQRPAVVLMDLALPMLNGIDATRAIISAVPDTKIIVLTSYSDDDYVQQAIEAGAMGFVLKETAATELLTAIREVFCGNAFFSPPIARRLRDRNRNAGTSQADTLTLREAQVLQMIADGCPNKKIAVDLGISIKTVEKHRQQVMNKLGIHHTAGLTRFVMNRSSRHPYLPPRTDSSATAA